MSFATELSLVHHSAGTSGARSWLENIACYSTPIRVCRESGSRRSLQSTLIWRCPQAGGTGVGSGVFRGAHGIKDGWLGRGRRPNIDVEKAGGLRYNRTCIRPYMFPAGIRSLKTKTVAGSLRETPVPPTRALLGTSGRPCGLFFGSSGICVRGRHTPGVPVPLLCRRTMVTPRKPRASTHRRTEKRHRYSPGENAKYASAG